MPDESPTFWDMRAKLARPQREARPPEADRGDPWSVTQLAARLDGAVRRGLPDSFRLRGEIGGWRISQTGHAYFTIKDSSARLDGVVYASTLRRLTVLPDNGDEVVVRGRASFYKPTGKLSIVCDAIEPAGEGAIEAAIRRLKEKLAAEGLFDPVNKLPTSVYPTRVVLVTSPNADALQDVLKVLRPYGQIRLALYPVAVQGETAADAIAAALRHLDEQRGGTGASTPSCSSAAAGLGRTCVPSMTSRSLARLRQVASRSSPASGTRPTRASRIWRRTCTHTRRRRRRG